MRLRALWREAFLAAMMLASISVLSVSIALQGLTGLITIGVGVFIGVLGIGTYDTWYDRLAKEKAKPKLRAKR